MNQLQFFTLHRLPAITLCIPIDGLKTTSVTMNLSTVFCVMVGFIHSVINSCA